MKSQLNDMQLFRRRGCIKWDMKFMSLSETTKIQQEKKLKMKMLSEQTDFSPDEVITLMKCTYNS